MNVATPPPIRSAYFLFLFVFFSGYASSQRNIAAEIENAIKEKEFQKADSLLQARIDYFFNQKQLDSLPKYTQLMGRVAEKLRDQDFALAQLTAFIERINLQGGTARVMFKVYAEAGEYYGSIGLNEKAYNANLEARRLALSVPDLKQEELGSISSDLGTFAYRLGNVKQSEIHHREAIAIFLKAKAPDYESLYVAGNNMGGIMWMASKMDSAIYYYQIALNALSKTEKTPINQYYRPAVLQNNMAALYNMQGKTTQAIEAMHFTIDNLKRYLAIPESVPKKANTISFQFEATDNLAGIYKELGDYSRAHELLTYSYDQKKRNTDDDKTGVFKSEILLGQLYLAMKEHDKAKEFLEKGLDNISKEEGDFLFWQADACNALAQLFEEQDQPREAAMYFEKADSLYELSLQGSYDDIYLQFLRNASLFYARNNELPKALSKANKGYKYVTENQGNETLLAFYQLLNLAEVHLLAGRYNEASAYSRNGINVVDRIAAGSENLLDSIKVRLKKPKAVLLNARARYAGMDKKTVEGLKPLLSELEDAMATLEKRKAVISDSRDLGLLMQDHSELVGFIKKLNLDLYNITRDQGYMEKIINLHENGMYTRIRTRLDKSDSISFANLPASIQEEERQLKTAISSALNSGTNHAKSMEAYFKAVDDWGKFQVRIKKEYPQYYRLRYESIFKSLGDIQQSVPQNASLIRYLFIDRDLYALVADRTGKQLFALSADGIEKKIRSLSDYRLGISESAPMLVTLYNQLWSPLSKAVKHQKVIIIPDGILFQLNFEILTPEKITDYRQLATQSLLAKHTISYHYSLALVGQKNNSTGINQNFVVFAPGFLEKEKQQYQETVTDPAKLDHAYISLLPQPFTVEFAKKASNLFDGDAYMHGRSTAESFRENAGQHRIIHIGTHAEASNLAPEFSRLIFAKGPGGLQSNSIYLHEIYGCDLRSELAVLTACESGKPGYEDGEGMISLAHAFNYAGSQSILTGLWKIDEQTSAIILDGFYANLKEGMSKDEALRQAKLTYLANADGRMLAPQYWAGLVLMGDTDPIELRTKNTFWIWLALGAIVLAGAVFLFRKRSVKH